LKGLLYARVIRMKNDWKSLTFWLAFPFLLTYIAIRLIGLWGEDTKIPIGLVVERESQLSNQLIEKLSDVAYLDVRLLNEREAINELEKHELDSVFILQRQYEEAIMGGKRKGVIDAYSSNRSYAYFAVKELVTSFVQDDVSRVKAAYEVRDLFKEYKTDEKWNWEEIVQESIEKQETQQLLQTSFSYLNNESGPTEDGVFPIINTWGIWALFSLMTTFFLFDWVIKEKREELHIRWLFTSTGFEKFASFGLIIYTVIMILIDALTFLLLSVFLQQQVSVKLWLSLFIFRIVINLLAFLFVNLFRQSLIYYVGSIGFTLILMVLGGAIIPVEGVTKQWSWVENLSPITSLLNEQIPYVWLTVLLGLFCIWYWKGDKLRA